MAEHRLQLRLSSTDWKRLLALSEAEGISPSDLMRELLDAAWEAQEVSKRSRGEGFADEFLD